LQTLLKWVENKDIHQPHGFSGALDDENIDVERICSQLVAWNRNQDLEMVLMQKNTLRSQFEESVTHLLQLIVAYVRCGQIENAIDLTSQAGCYTMSGLIDSRSALFDPKLTPIDVNDENYGFCESRKSFKHLARNLITKVFIKCFKI
jgi:hypothetical protein